MGLTHSVIEDFVAAFNVAVETDDYRQMLDTLSADVVVSFQGSLEPPYTGHAGAAEAWRRNRPDDEIGLLDWRTDGDEEVLTFSWLNTPDVSAGEMRLTVVGDKITRITID